MLGIISAKVVDYLTTSGDGAVQQSLAEHMDDVHAVAFSPNGEWLDSSGEDQTVKLWRLEKSRQ